jgi:hypothetical protein
MIYLSKYILPRPGVFGNTKTTFPGAYSGKQKTKAFCLGFLFLEKVSQVDTMHSHGKRCATCFEPDGYPISPE